MSLVPLDIAALDSRTVLITTNNGQPVSIGRLKVTRFTLDDIGARVDIHFETEQMSCVLGVAQHKLEALRKSWNGECYFFRLPPGDAVWLPRVVAESAPQVTAAPEIETFPLPQAGRPTSPLPLR